MEPEQNDQQNAQARARQNRDLAKKTKEGAIWTVLFDAVEFVIQTGSSIILARILFPEDYGLMGLASISIQLARRFTNFGFNLVLVQRKTLEKEHLDTVFWTNLGLMVLTTALLVVASPFLSDFFNEPRLTAILIAVSINFIFSAIGGVSQALMKRKMQFKELGLSVNVSNVSGIVLSVVLALMDYGVWSLVYGQLFTSLSQSLMMMRQARWLPRFSFKMWALKDCMSFGLWVFLSSFIGFGINKIDYTFIGKFLGTSPLGIYEKAFETMSLPRKKIVRKMNSLIFSSLSRIQDDNELVVKAFLRVVAYLSVVIYPAMVWLFFAAPSLILFMYGEKWSGVIIPLQIMCVSGLLDSFSLVFQPLLHAKGLVGNHTKRQILQLLGLTAGVLVGLNWGIIGVSWGVTAASLFFYGLMLHTTVKVLPMTLRGFFGVQRSVFFYSLILIALLGLLTTFGGPYLGETSPLMLLAISALTVIGYVGAHLIFRFRDVDDIFQELFSEVGRFSKKFTKFLPQR